MRIAFAGTPEFARAALAALADAGHEVALVLTQPDRPAGRGLKLQASPVRQEAQRRGLPVVQPRSLRLDGRWPDEARGARDALAAAAVDGLVVAAYGLILPRWTLELPLRGGLNIHASLLPRWRGAAPIQRCLEAGDAHTGITLMQMDEGLDTGPMLARESIGIAADDTAATLHDRLAVLGAGMVVRALPDWGAGRLVPEAQPEAGACYAAKIEKSESAIDWSAPAAVIERRARAFDPFPGLAFRHGDQDLKLWRARLAAGGGQPGEVLQADARGLTVACGDGALQLLELQRPGGRRTTAAELLRALPLAAGTLLLNGRS